MMEYRPSLKRKAAGWCLLVLGVLGIVLPFLQGFLFLALGMFVLRDQYLWAHRGMGWIEARWPNAVVKAEALEARLARRANAGIARVRGLLGRN